MSKFLNPFTDFGFKKIFGQEVSKDLLIDFLNSLLVKEHKITEIQSISYLNKEYPGRGSKDRTLIYDIFCKTDKDEQIIVEMQNKKHENFIDRMLYYGARSISEQGKKGDKWNYEIKAVYCIAFMNFKVDVLKDFRTDVILANKADGKMVCDKLKMIFLQLPLFDTTDPDKCEDNFTKWIYVLKNMETLERMPYAAKNAVFKKLETIASLSELTRSERARYDHEIKVIRDNYMFECQAKRDLERAKKEGLEKGREEGLEKGREEGLEKGREEAKLETAKNLKLYGVSLDIIAATTGLDIDYLKEVLK